MNERTTSRRLFRQKRTLRVMLRLYCRHVHGTRSGLCPACGDLLEYAYARVEQCRLLPDKPTCAKCPVHCYRPDARERIREVMRYSGPRMILRHPLLALLHLLDGLRQAH